MKYITHIIGLAALILAAGCVSTGNVPSGAKLVGGGLDIEWEAPVNGTAILVETSTMKTVATKSLEDGDSFEFHVTRAENAAVLSTFFPVMPTNAHFVLYFVPSPTKD